MFKFASVVNPRIVNALQGLIGGAFGGGAGSFTAGVLEGQSGRDLFISTVQGFALGGGLGATFGYFKKIPKPINETGGIEPPSSDPVRINDEEVSGTRLNASRTPSVIVDHFVDEPIVNQISGDVWNGKNWVSPSSLDPKGEFSIWNWSGYPEGGPVPSGPFRIVNPTEYSDALRLKNNMNQSLHNHNPNWKGLQLHEVHPVKFGGSPTDYWNKTLISSDDHIQFSRFWQILKGNITKKVK